MNALRLAKRNGPFQGFAIQAEVASAWVQTAARLVLKEVPKELFHLVGVNCPRQYATPRPGMGHALSLEMHHLAQFVLAELGPFGHGPAARLSCQLGKHADHEQCCSRLADPARVSAIRDPLQLGLQSFSVKKESLVGKTKPGCHCCIVHEQTFRCWKMDHFTPFYRRKVLFYSPFLILFPTLQQPWPNGSAAFIPLRKRRGLRRELVMDEHAMDATVTYQDLEPMIEAEIYDPLPEGLVEQQWLELPGLDQNWLELPEIEQNWLELSELEQDWPQKIDQGAPELSLEVPDLEQGFDLER
jgi:hypothetical protein